VGRPRRSHGESGDQAALACLYDAGDYSYAARGAVHEPIPSDEGALLFIVQTA
jgi:hypothetical protein